MLNKVKAYIEKYNMIVPGDHLILGVSGGADSMCLLFVLNEIYGDDITLHIVHVNHGLRRAAESESLYVKSVAERMGISCSIIKEDVESIADNLKLSTEEAGRMVRYRAFEEESVKYGNCRIAVAHNITDNAETVLFNMFRGSSLNGICGIKPVNEKIVRPLLCLSREEIEGYLKSNNILYCQDESNLGDEYTRNIIRHRILPVAQESVNAACAKNIFSLSESLLETEDYLRAEEQRLLERAVIQSDRKLRIIYEEIENLHIYMQKRVIYRCIINISGRARDIEKKHVDKILYLFGQQVGRSISLPYDIVAERVYDGVELKEKEVIFSKCESEIKLSDGCEFSKYKVNINLINIEETDTYPKEKYTKWFDYDKIVNIPVIRNRREGDYISVNAFQDKQKLKKFFINEKIPKQERDNIPLICDGQSVMWIVGYRMSSEYQISNTTKRVLQIKISTKLVNS